VLAAHLQTSPVSVVLVILKPISLFSGLYSVLNSTAAFGPLYRRIEACFEGDHEILFQVRGNAPELTE
jgi:hypothetical protein